MEPTIAPQRSYKFLTFVIVVVLILVFAWMWTGGSSSTEIAPAVDTVVETVATTTAQ